MEVPKLPAEMSSPEVYLADEVPPSPFHDDLQYLHLSLQQVTVNIWTERWKDGRVGCHGNC